MTTVAERTLKKQIINRLTGRLGSVVQLNFYSHWPCHQ